MLTNDQMLDAAHRLEMGETSTFTNDATREAFTTIIGNDPYQFMSMGEGMQTKHQDLIPDTWGISMHRTGFDGKMLWTVSLSLLKRTIDLASIENSVAARSEDLENAVAAAVIRAALKIEPPEDIANAKAA